MDGAMGTLKVFCWVCWPCRGGQGIPPSQTHIDTSGMYLILELHVLYNFVILPFFSVFPITQG